MIRRLSGAVAKGTAPDFLLRGLAAGAVVVLGASACGNEAEAPAAPVDYGPEQPAVGGPFPDIQPTQGGIPAPQVPPAPNGSGFECASVTYVRVGGGMVEVVLRGQDGRPAPEGTQGVYTGAIDTDTRTGILVEGTRTEIPDNPPQYLFGTTEVPNGFVLQADGSYAASGPIVTEMMAFGLPGDCRNVLTQA